MKSEDLILDLNDLTDKNINQYGLIEKNIRNDFNLLIENFSIKNYHPSWILSSVASREPDFSPLFSRCCNLELIRFNIENNPSLEQIVIYDKQLSISIKKYCNSKKLPIYIKYEKTKWPFFTSYLYLKKFIRSFFLVIMTIIAKSLTSKNIHTRSSPLILLSTHIFKNSPDELTKESYIDRYYPNLYSYLNKNQADNIVFVPGFPGGFQNYIKLFKKIKLSDINFLLKSDILRINDYFYAFFSSSRVLFIKTPITFFKGFEITNLIKSELNFHSFDYKIIEALLNYRFVYRLKTNKINITKFVDWHENNLASKGFMLGFNKFLPQVSTIGYQGIIDSAAYLINLHPTIFERLSMQTPHIYIVIGEALVSHLKEFDNQINVLVGPSFRYNYLWEDKILIQNLNEFNILITLPISITEANCILDLLNKTLELLPRNFLLKVRVKYHPTYSQLKIKKLLLVNDNRVKFIVSSFIDCIFETRLLISGASTTCIESMAIGIPVVVAGSKAGVMNVSIPNSVPADLYKIIVDETHLSEYISSLIDQNKYIYVNKLLRKRYFKKVDSASVALLFDS